MKRQGPRHCQHCGEQFTPERRNRYHQAYCNALICRAASKKASQAKWLAKNPDYHRGPDAVARVQAWRRDHPGYSQNKRRTPVAESPPPAAVTPATPTPPPAAEAAPRQKSCNAQTGHPALPLQDILDAQPIVLIGLIAHIWGSALQEDIASALRRLVQLGHDIR